MRVLVVTKIFPNAIEPHSSPFNRQQFAELGRLCDVEVLATIPWFPFARTLAKNSGAARLADVPPRDDRFGVPVEHPRFLYVPKVGVPVAGALYAASLLRPLVRRSDVDVILASWAYPDGAAAVALGSLLKRPVVVKLHGSDMNVIAERPSVRAQLRAALPRAAAVVAVSRPLAERATELGARRVHVVANGIDAARFSPRDRGAARDELGLPRERRVIVFVGRLEREKGALDLLDAFSRMQRRDVTLVLVGDGSVRREIESAASERVRVLGARPHGEIAKYIAAADVLTLPSWAEGTPNVVLEALASGRRVVATHVGGVPDVLRSSELGVMVPPRDPIALAAALDAEIDRPYVPESVVAAAGLRTWADSARELFEVLKSSLPGNHASREVE